MIEAWLPCECHLDMEGHVLKLYFRTPYVGNNLSEKECPDITFFQGNTAC